MIIALFLALGLAGPGCTGPTSQPQDPTASTTNIKNLRTFEDVHVVEYKQTCQSCHVSREAASYLRIEAGVVEVAPTNDRVIVDRNLCFSCHLSSIPIYGNQMIKAGTAY